MAGQGICKLYEQVNACSGSRSSDGVRAGLANILKLKNKNGEQFIEDLPHYYFEENQLHSFILSLNKSFADLIPKIKIFTLY